MLTNNRNFIRAALLVFFALAITTVVLIKTTSNNSSSTVHALEAATYGFSLPSDAIIQNHFEWRYSSWFEGSKNTVRFYKISVGVNGFDGLFASLVAKHGAFLRNQLPRKNQKELSWWDECKYDSCYSKKLSDRNSNQMLQLYLLKDGTNRWILAEQRQSK